MKLVIVLSIIAYGYAEKLDRAYLPPVNAATAGGSPGSLIAPGVAPSRPGSSQGPTGQVDLGQGLPTGSGQSRPTYGGVSGGAQNGPSFGTAFNQGSAATASGRPGSLIGLGVSSLRLGSNQRPASQVDLGQGLPTGSGQSRPTYGGVSGGAQNGPSFGTGFKQGVSGINQLPGAGANALEPIGKAPLLGANAPIAQGQTFGSSLTPTNTFNVGGQQITRPQAGGYSNQGFGQGTQGSQGFNAPQTQSYKPERPQAAADRNAEILKYVNENNGESYLYSYETSNGISAEESGVATNGVRAQGGFSYTGDDGQAYSLTYTADENGFRPQGEHLPTPHPIPEEILKSIEENARAAAAGTQEGAYRPEEYESEGSAQQYNIGQSSFNRPQGSIQGTLSQGPSSQSSGNKASAIQGAFGPSGQIGQSKPSQFASGPSVSQGQITQYQQGSASNQGKFGPSTGQTGQFGQARPSQGYNQFASGSTGNQYQTGLGSSQGLSGQISGQGSVTQGLGPTSQGSSGYNYNQPQSTFGAQFGSGIQSQNRPQFNQGQTPSASGSQQTFGLQTGKIPSSETPFGSAQGSQFGLSQSQSSFNRPTGSTGIFGQGQIGDSNKPFGSSQASQLRPGNLGNSETSGYQYQANANRPSYGNNQTPGIGSQPSQGSQYQPNSNQAIYGSNGIKGSSPFGAGNVGSNNQIGQSQQYQTNGNRPFGGNTGSYQESSSLGGISGIQKPGSGSFTGQVNRPSFGSNVGPSQGSSQFAPGNQQSTSAQGPAGTKGSTSIQAPYQYDRPSQSFPSQGPSGSLGNQGSLSPIATGGSLVSQGFNGQKPGVSQGQRPGFNSQETQDYMNGRPSFMGTKEFNVQRPDGSSSVSQGSNGSPSLTGSQGFNGQRPGSSFSGSPSVTGQRPTFTASQGASQGPSGSSSGFQFQGQRPSLPGSTVSQGNQNQPEQFGGPRQPPSFSPEEGYKY